MKLARIVLDQLRQFVLYITPSKLEKFLLEMVTMAFLTTHSHMIFVKYAQIMDTQLRYVLRNLPWMLEVVHFRGGLLIDLGCKTVVLVANGRVLMLI
jgi:hypothetical protein